ncbi:MAG: type I secretion C-terminal target domain-containing protein [Alphaproteobacteria bacterium]|nr:type I secretion C-terminal target domain-containing protein [Alphaproteobacteria bacterium]
MATFDFLYNFPAIDGALWDTAARTSGVLHELLRAGAVSDADAGSFTVANTTGTNRYRLVVGGEDLTYLDGRPADGTVTSLRLFLESGLEVARIEGLALGLAQALAIPSGGSPGSGAFHDLLYSGDDVIWLGGGVGFISDGGPGADTIFGAVGGGIYGFDDPRDRLVLPADGGYDRLDVRYGSLSQVLTFSVGSGRLAGLEGLSYGGVARVRLVGGAAGNRLRGGSYDDTLSGGGGADVLTGVFGNDSLIGGAGDDNLSGGTGRDTLLGGAGHDILYAQETGNRLDGGSGDDMIYEDGGNTVLGGAGADTVYFEDAGASLIRGGSGNDFLFPEDIGTIGATAHTLDGGAGNDTILVAAGLGNLLLGGTGNDTLEGGAGADLLAGGTGADHFRLGLDGVDTIADFSSRQGDRIDLTAIFPARAPGVFDARGLQELLEDGYLRFEQAGGNLNLFVDADGAAGAGAEVQVAILRDVATLTEADFQLV